MSTLRENLESGSSYLTMHDDNPEIVGKILADNIEAVTIALHGEEYSDDDLEFVIDAVSSCLIDGYNKNLNVENAVAEMDRYAKARGGIGWL